MVVIMSIKDKILKNEIVFRLRMRKAISELPKKYLIIMNEELQKKLKKI